MSASDDSAATSPSRPGNTGRFSADDWLVDQFVLIASKPKLLVLATVGNMLACGLIYSLIEHKGPIEGVWWAIVTGFTVGYGDQYPATTAGRGLGAFLILSSFVLALCLASQITSRLVSDDNAFTHHEQEEMKASLARIEALLAARDGGSAQPAGSDAAAAQPTVRDAQDDTGDSEGEQAVPTTRSSRQS